MSAQATTLINVQFGESDDGVFGPTPHLAGLAWLRNRRRSRAAPAE